MRLRGLAIGVAVLVSMPLLGAPAAAAKPRAPALAITCYRGEFCVSKDTYYNGTTWKFQYADSNWAFVDYWNLNDEDSSWRGYWMCQ